jgi:glucosylceramidase
MKKLFYLILVPLFNSAIAICQVATIYTTAKNTEFRLSNTQTIAAGGYQRPTETEPFILIDTLHTFQTFVGIGGAVTDASAEVFAKLPPKVQQDFLKAYYDSESGIGYSLMRTSMNSCDFSSDSYTYVKENDESLSTFDVKHDEQFRIPLIKRALAIAGGNISIFISPWSPPAWMKSNNNMLQGGKLLPKYYQSWANYYVKFIQAYEKKGIPIWGMTIQNEPMALQRWESCVYTAEEERDFIKNYLGKTLQSNGLGDKKIIVWDHNRDLIYQRASVILNDKDAAKYVWGIGYHWYETWTGNGMNFANVKLVNNAFPDKKLIFTEGCIEKFNMDSIKNWELGEKYAYSMINDFNSSTVAWTDWNILLDENGGPNHVKNYCFSPIHANTRTGELIFTNAYYYIGHFSKFIKSGAKRVACSTNNDNLLSVAFKNKNNNVVLVVMNRSNKDIQHKLFFGDKSFDVNILSHSINTIILK